MTTKQIVKALIHQRDRLHKAIQVLQGSAERVAKDLVPRRTRKRIWSAARKKAQAAKMKAYWAKKRGKKLLKKAL